METARVHYEIIMALEQQGYGSCVCYDGFIAMERASILVLIINLLCFDIHNHDVIHREWDREQSDTLFICVLQKNNCFIQKRQRLLLFSTCSVESLSSGSMIEPEVSGRWMFALAQEAALLPVLLPAFSSSLFSVVVLQVVLALLVVLEEGWWRVFAGQGEWVPSTLPLLAVFVFFELFSSPSNSEGTVAPIHWPPAHPQYLCVSVCVMSICCQITQWLTPLPWKVST